MFHKSFFWAWGIITNSYLQLSRILNLHPLYRQSCWKKRTKKHPVICSPAGKHGDHQPEPEEKIMARCPAPVTSWTDRGKLTKIWASIWFSPSRKGFFLPPFPLYFGFRKEPGSFGEKLLLNLTHDDDKWIRAFLIEGEAGELDILENRRLRDVFSVCINVQWEGMKKQEPDSSREPPLRGQEGMGAS